MNYRTPGVYIQEISKFPPSVAQVETAIPAFIGYTQKAADELGSLNLKPKRITSLLEYETYFGTTLPYSGLTIAINETTDDGTAAGKVIARTVAATNSGRALHNMYYAMQAFFANGGGPCYIVSVGAMSATPTITQAALESGVDAIEKEDEVTLIVFPEIQALGASELAGVVTKALNQCGKLQDRFVVTDILPPGTGETILDAADNFRNESLPLDFLKYGAAYTPNVMTTFNYVFDDTVVINHTVNGTNTAKTLAAFKPDQNDPSVGNAILYNLTLAAIDRVALELPAAPLVVGQYAATDSNRGVWKAPANVALASVIEPAIKITHEQQQDLNVHSSGKSVNAIRSFPGKGTLIWGARTLAGNDNEWRYVPVRRFFNMAEESIKKAAEQFVFEPNDANTWTKVRAMIENFLLLQWRAGALAGAVPEQAFYVSVGLGVTMTALDILEGRMNVEVGMAVVRPAEFIILKFSHKMQES